DGADIIDVGAMSTRPFSEPVSVDEEISRLEPVFKRVTGAVKIPVSIDTFNIETARFALENGAAIINSVGEFSEDMVRLAKEYNAGFVICHTLGLPSESVIEYENGVITAVRSFFEETLEKALEIGLKKENIIFDPGFGFSKDAEQCIELLHNISKVKIPGAALLAAVSKKRFTKGLFGKSEYITDGRDTTLANYEAVRGGADIIRVHDVRSQVLGIRR
ncbi:MAG: dihydropteroate synthase, partial [Oscillospiraceae bacterium]|nr:dihydropteroate synthase [Oscillospiraceae bacterium]